jgi:hypothetical protein
MHWHLSQRAKGILKIFFEMKKCTTCGHKEVPPCAYETCIDCMQAFVEKAIDQEEMFFAEAQKMEIEAFIKTPVKIFQHTVQVDVQSKFVF